MDQKVPPEFVIEHGVPIKRAGRNGVWRKYPFDTMKPGDSFAVPADIDPEKLRNAASAFGKDNRMKFSVLLVEKDPDRYRCWRLS